MMRLSGSVKFFWAFASGVDRGQLVPMTDAIEANLGRKPEQLSADAGYCSEANLEALENRSIDGYVATGRARDAVAGTVKGEITATTPSPEPAGAPTRVEAMRAKIRAGGHASPYRLRKQLPEPVFGQIKQARGFRQFLLRGFANVRARSKAERLSVRVSGALRLLASPAPRPLL